MVPAAIMVLDELPLTANGKVDRKALPEQGAQVRGCDICVQPENEIQERIAGIWRKVLGRDEISILDNFIELGAHSLLLVQVHYALQHITSHTLRLVDLFKYPTIASLASYLAGDKSNQEQSATQLHSDVENRKRANAKQSDRLSKRRASQ
jgi:acyl carrier protein